LTNSSLEEYLQTADLPRLLRKLGAQNVELIVDEIHHFSKKEGEKRDKIVVGYFDESGVKQIVDSIVNRLTTRPKLKPNAKILDIGAGSGFFTARIASEVKKLVQHASFYAMDATPAMLLALAKKKEEITPFFGIAENIQGSIENARGYAIVPERFDAVISTLMLHHCPDLDRVFKSVRKVLKPTGKAVVVDLCTHMFTEFREEMGDLHLGFDPDLIHSAAKKVFSKVSVDKLPGICCTSSGRSAELFVATLKP